MSNLIATDELGISLQKLREMIATSETFQEGVQGGYGDALDRVYIGRRSGALDRPFAQIESESFGAGLIAGGSMNHLRLNGDIRMHIEVDADTTLDEADQLATASAFCLGVLSDINDMAALDNTVGEFDESHLPTVRVAVSTFGKNEKRFWRSLGQWFNCIATISWGDG